MPTERREKNPWPTALASLHLPNFRWLFIGNVALFFAVQGQIVARVYLAWELTKSESALAYVSMAVAIPMLLASTVSGAVADRLNRKHIIIIGQSLILISEIFILAMLFAESVRFWQLLLVSFVTGCAFPFIIPARMTMIYDIAGPNYFSNAMGLGSGVVNLSRVAGPAVIGVVLDVFDARAAYIIAASLHLVAILCMFRIKIEQAPLESKQGLSKDVVEGFRYVYGHRAVLVCILFGLLPIMLAQPIQSLYVVFAKEIWSVGERGFGLLLAASGLGGLLGSIWVAGRRNESNRVLLVAVCVVGLGVFLFAFSLSPSFWLAVAMLVLANIFASAGQTLNQTVTLLMTDRTMKGRVSGLMGMSFGLTPLGVLPLAFAAEAWGVDLAVAGASIIVICLAVGCFLASPVLRGLDRELAR